jgi:hypothetical protein
VARSSVEIELTPDESESAMAITLELSTDDVGAGVGVVATYNEASGVFEAFVSDEQWPMLQKELDAAGVPYKFAIAGSDRLSARNGANW